VAAPTSKLLDRVHQAIRTRHYSDRTEKASVHWTKRFIVFHQTRHPVEMGEAEISQFLSSLATEAHVSASTQNQALNALVFLYQDVLEKKIGLIEGVVRAKRPRRLPSAPWAHVRDHDAIRHRIVRPGGDEECLDTSVRTHDNPVTAWSPSKGNRLVSLLIG
jgi:hypothetical protein